MNHYQVILGLFILLIVVQWWQLGKLSQFWQATVG